MKWGLFILATLCALTFGAAQAKAERLTVFAAASLKTALDEVAEEYEAQTGAEISLSYAGSSVLARQIALGAPADVFLSANSAWMDYLEASTPTVAETRFDLLANRLALIGHGAEGSDPQTISGDFDLAARLGDSRLAMALVDAVPAGIYGKAALSHLGLWEAVAPRVVQADNVRAALKLVALGEAQLGVTYSTDAMAEPSVHLIGLFPEDSHPPIRYPAALTRDSAGARAFLNHLQGAEARAIFERHGFTVLGAE
jgi:molybdate transport system substrate-binding protein